MSKSQQAGPGADLPLKQQQFNICMEAYNYRPTYTRIGRIISIINVTLQLYLLVRVLPFSIGPIGQLAALLLAYLSADFINGLVHMYMDNNDQYDTPAGPLIASFHLHHKTPVYKQNPLWLVYFNETGSKLWLVVYLAAAVLLLEFFGLPPLAAYVLMYFGILSSVAEVAHYLCHVPKAPWKVYFEKTGLLLSTRHHARHHLADNRDYAFLNGVTDPLLNMIARRIYPGYKTTTDPHYAAYVGPNTENRD
jgi:hypothetical protein